MQFLKWWNKAQLPYILFLTWGHGYFYKVQGYIQYMTHNTTGIPLVKVFPFIPWNKQTSRGEISTRRRQETLYCRPKWFPVKRPLARYISPNIYLRWYKCPSFSIDHQLQYPYSWMRVIVWGSAYYPPKRKQQRSDNGLSLSVRYWR